MEDEMSEKPVNVAPLYVMIWEQAVESARAKGYAIAVHGSLNRDLDLVAIPWTDGAASAEELVEAIADGLAWVRDDRPVIDGPQEKPHGRKAWTIPFMKNWHVDLSVMPRIKGEL